MTISPHLIRSLDVEDFHRKGFLTLALSGSAHQLVLEIADLGRTLFRRDEALKMADSVPDIHEGWHAFGGEFSITPDRPDLHESFWVTRRHAAIASPRYSLLATRLHNRMLAYLDIIQDLERLILHDLLAAYGADPSRELHSKRSLDSDLQLLYYEPRIQKRALLQDPHEDSLSLTFTWADRPGLELLGVDGRYRSPGSKPNEVVVLPGEIMSLLSGFRIAPLVHRVVRHIDQDERLTLSYFSAPDVEPARRILPWVEAAPIATTSIADRVRANRIKYLVP